MSARYITTTLPYVNADPHIGFAAELARADALARACRAAGHDVFFATGTDEYGQKIFESAEKKGQDAQAYVDHYADEVRKLREALSLSTDAFTRTTSPEHAKAAQEMWKRCDAAGDIYKKAYTGLYCVGCEAFKTEREIKDGRCELHPSLELQTLTEENYFFRLSKYSDALLAYLGRPGVVVPEWRREEALTFVKQGLEDFSISREKARLAWGVPVPGDDTQVMYVWFDALTSYLSALGWPDDARGDFKKFWQEGQTLQMAGKDQVRFQAIMWQAMLFSTGIKNTDQVFCGGFINSGGQRMSKSLGNVISPYELVKKYGTEATRYLLLRHVHPTEDTDVTWERLDEWYTANLVNGLGNLVARVMQLAEKNLDGPVAAPAAAAPPAAFSAHIDAFEFSRAADYIWEQIQILDKKITDDEPFKVVKTEPEKGKTMIAAATLEVLAIARLLGAFMPATAQAIEAAVLANKKPENLFPRLAA